MLGAIDKKIKDFLRALQHRGGIVSNTIAIAVANAFINDSLDPSLKNVKFRRPWTQSPFGRMGFVRRLATIAKVPIPDKARKEIEFVFMHKIVQKVEKHLISYDLSSTSIKLQ